MIKIESSDLNSLISAQEVHNALGGAQRADLLGQRLQFFLKQQWSTSDDRRFMFLTFLLF